MPNRGGCKTNDGQFAAGPQELACFAQCFTQGLVMKAGYECDDVEGVLGCGEVPEVRELD